MVPGENAPEMAGKVIEQAKLGGRGRNEFSADRERHGGWIDRDFTNGERAGRKRAFEAAEYGLYAGHEFAGAERLGDVIVGSDLKTEDAVSFTALGSEENYRHGSESGCLADRAAEFETVFAGDHDVEHEERWTLARGVRDHCGAVGIDADGKSIVLQVVANQAGDIGIVFDDEDAWFHGFIVTKGVAST
jgi:hypothetical protein